MVKFFVHVNRSTQGNNMLLSLTMFEAAAANDERRRIISAICEI
jgi:hypothetical protein